MFAKVLLVLSIIINNSTSFVIKNPNIHLRVNKRCLLNSINNDAANTPSTNARKYIRVPFNEKEEAKSLGAQWDSSASEWYVSEYLDGGKFDRWTKIYLDVPFDSKDEAKKRGAGWDKTAKKWFIAKSSNLEDFAAWIPVEKSAKKIYTKKNNIISVLHIATNGLPERVGFSLAPYDDLEKYASSRIVKLSYMLCNSLTLKPIKTNVLIIKPTDFTISNTLFHGVSYNDAIETGVPFETAVNELITELKQSDIIYAFGADFTFSVLKSELFRNNLLDSYSNNIENIKKICIMEDTKQIVGLKTEKDNFKSPTLVEFYNFATKQKVNKFDYSFTQTIDVLHESLKSLVDNGLYKISK